MQPTQQGLRQSLKQSLKTGLTQYPQITPPLKPDVRFHISKKILASTLLIGMLFLLFSNRTQAQGLFVDIRSNHQVMLPRPIPRPTPATNSYKIKSIEIDAIISGQIAKVQVSQTFKNTGTQQMEVCFMFPLPYDGAIDRMTFMINGQEHEAKLLSAKEARKIYEETVRKNKDPALLEWIGNGMFKTSVFPIPAGASRTVSLRYTQICRKNHSLTDFVFPLSTAKYTSGAIEKLTIKTTLVSKTPIQNIYSSSHKIVVQRSDARHATILVEEKNSIPGEDFRLFYDSSGQEVGASLISYRPKKDENGYFILPITPKIKSEDNASALSKTLIFVIDRSGSMSGKKIEQAKASLKFVINNLNDGDLFNIVSYASEISTFRPELQKFDSKTRADALGYIEAIQAGGGTDINGALNRAFEMIQDNTRPNYLIFMTDGLPTSGETNEAKITANSKIANNMRARLFSFGVGYDVNSRLLDKLSNSNFGQSEYVRPDEDIETAVSKFYAKIGSPVLTNVVANFQLNQPSAPKTKNGGSETSHNQPTNRVYPKGEFDLFAGQQLVLVGRYTQSGEGTLTLRGTVNGKEQSFEFPFSLVAHSSDDTNAFVGKLWATRRVGELINEIDLKGQNDELLKELVELATKHGIITQYTSFMADEENDRHNLTENLASAAHQTRALKETNGRYGFSQRKGKSVFRQNSAGEASGLQLSSVAPVDELKNIAMNSKQGASYFDAKSGKNRAVRNVTTLGTKTFFQRKKVWVDSSLTAEEEKNATVIKRYSKPYFDLVAKYGKKISLYMAVDDPVIVKIEGKVYRW